MKRGYMLIIILLFFPIFAYSQQASIYEQIGSIRSNPKAYTLVIGRTASPDEVKSASELAGFLGVTKSRFDVIAGPGTNLVVAGVFGNNQKIDENAKGTGTKGILIKTANTNLIVAGSNVDNLEKAVELVRNYKKNKERLLTDELSSLDLFAPVMEMFSGTVMAYATVLLLIVGSSAAIVMLRKKRFFEGRQFAGNQPAAQNQAYAQIRNYVGSNLSKGYSEGQIKAALAKAGWKPELLNSVFNEVKGFYRK